MVFEECCEQPTAFEVFVKIFSSWPKVGVNSERAIWTLLCRIKNSLPVCAQTGTVPIQVPLEHVKMVSPINMWLGVQDNLANVLQYRTRPLCNTKLGHPTENRESKFQYIYFFFRIPFSGENRKLTGGDFAKSSFGEMK